MAGEFPAVQLGDLVELDTGFAFKSADFVNEGIRLTRGDNVKRGQFEWGEKAKFWPTVTQELARYQLLVGDVLIGMDGSRVGENWARVSEADLPALLVQRVARLRAKSGNDQDFIWYLIANERFISYIKGVATGTSIPHISGTQIKGFEVPAPPLKAQRQISAVLRSIDEKIDLNRKMAATLEDMAQALFKSWFVDFDPVHANAEGRKTGLSAEIATLFPNSFNDEGLPIGWINQSVEVYLQLAYGKSLPSNAREPGAIPVYGSGGIGGYHNEALVQGPGIVVGRKGSVGTLYWEQGDFFPIDTVFFVKPNEGYSLSFIWEMLRTFPLKEMNADGAVPGLNRSHALQLVFACPPSPLRAAFDEFAISIASRMTTITNELVSLNSLRDTLLPKLLSGELRLADAENVVAAA